MKNMYKFAVVTALMVGGMSLEASAPSLAERMAAKMHAVAEAQARLVDGVKAVIKSADIMADIAAVTAVLAARSGDIDKASPAARTVLCELIVVALGQAREQVIAGAMTAAKYNEMCEAITKIVAELPISSRELAGVIDAQKRLGETAAGCRELVLYRDAECETLATVVRQAKAKYEQALAATVSLDGAEDVVATQMVALQRRAAHFTHATEMLARGVLALQDGTVRVAAKVDDSLEDAFGDA